MIVAGLATIPGREESLKRTVESLLPQVDTLGVCLNGFRDIPEWLENDDRLRFAIHSGTGPGDAGKFAWARMLQDGYALICDDDLEYPPDFAGRIVEAVERHERKALVGFGGRLVDKRKRMYRGQSWPALARVLGEHRVNILLTCAMGFHSSTLPVPEMPTPNMADIWLALAADKAGVPMYVLPHSADYFRHTFHPQTIWEESRKQTGSAMDTRKIQDALVMEHEWTQLS